MLHSWNVCLCLTTHLLFAFHVADVGPLHGSHVGHICVPCGSHVSYMWVAFVSHVGHMCVPCESHVRYMWVTCEFHLCPICVLCGSHLPPMRVPFMGLIWVPCVHALGASKKVKEICANFERIIWRTRAYIAPKDTLGDACLIMFLCLWRGSSDESNVDWSDQTTKLREGNTAVG